LSRVTEPIFLRLNVYIAHRIVTHKRDDTRVPLVEVRC